MNPQLGVCYYPEHWEPTLWQYDAKKMVDAGIQWVRIGEFSWSRIEPEPNSFDWDWLDKAIETLAQASLKVVLGTPTATPPRWMLKKYPDMLAVDINNNTRKFGSRRHYDFSHKLYRIECIRICEVLAKRYAHNSQIAFWQTDNEYGCHDTIFSYSPSALKGFQEWLEQKYSDINTLNRAWGNVFWSMEYQAFNEIALPNQCVNEPNPTHQLDFKRYSSEQVVLFNKAQVDAIRKYDHHTPILHNYMGRITNFDHFAVGKDLDAASWNSYPIGFLEDRIDDSLEAKAPYLRQGDPDFQAFHHDLYRAVGNGRWWVMEQQLGAVNWAPYNPAPATGMVRLWTWEAIAHGAEVVSYFRWRQLPFAQEQMHSGLLAPDNTPTPAIREIKKVAAEIRQLASHQVTPKKAHPHIAVALIFDYESAWAWDIQPQGESFNYFNAVFHQYRALRQLGLSIDICSSNHNDFSNYQLIVIPALMHWGESLQRALQATSATLLIGPRTGSKTKDFQIPESLPPNCDLFIAATITQVESLPPHITIPLKNKEEKHVGKIINWREYLTSEDTDKIILKDIEEQAICINQENSYYLAAWLNNEGYRNLFRHLCMKANITTCELPDGVRLRQWRHRMVITNYSSRPQSLESLIHCYPFIQSQLSAKTIKPFDVLVEKFE